jgi:hypothetical protein
MKGAASCDKPRGAASWHRSGGTRIGQPAEIHLSASASEQNRVWKRTRGTETSKYPEEEKERSIPSVAASERGRA